MQWGSICHLSTFPLQNIEVAHCIGMAGMPKSLSTFMGMSYSLFQIRNVWGLAMVVTSRAWETKVIQSRSDWRSHHWSLKLLGIDAVKVKWPAKEDVRKPSLVLGTSWSYGNGGKVTGKCRKAIMDPWDFWELRPSFSSFLPVLGEFWVVLVRLDFLL